MTLKQYSLVLYDTSDFEKFPIGGQLTSVRNFLRFIAEQHTEDADSILLVGVTTEDHEVGKIQKVIIRNVSFDFLPVLYRNSDLSSVQKSLRTEYLKALCRSKKLLPGSKGVVHYLHTPEAFIYLKTFHPFCKTAIFSHGSFFNMVSGFRFYQNSKLIGPMFNGFLKFLLRKADLIFTLDQVSTDQYLPYNENVIQVENSVVLPKRTENSKVLHDPARLLFVGRLSKVKRIDGIIRAVAAMDREELTIVGDGEERENLLALTSELNIENRVHFVGAVKPAAVSELMEQNDILVMNSTVEGKPMTIIEALSHGLPVIATPVGGIPEMVTDGENAVLTDGTETSIECSVGKIEGNFETFSQNALRESKKYDYRIVNKEIYSALLEVNASVKR